MYSKVKKPVDSLIQKTDDKNNDVNQNLKPKSVSLINDVRVAYKKRCSVIQREGPTLYKQIGPSCWLFVMEALVRYEGFDTKYLQIIMHSYESDSKKIDAKSKDKKVYKNRRVAALSATKDKLDDFLSRLTNYFDNRIKKGNKGDDISKEHAERLMLRTLGNTFISKYIFSHEKESVNIADLINEIKKANKKLESLIKTCQDLENDTEAFLNTGSMQIDKQQELNDVEETLKWIKKPSYMSICKIYKREESDKGNIIDFTSRTDLTDTAHAVLLVGYDESRKRVRYKNPNYGDDIFIVTAQQLQLMAGEHRVMIRPFYADNVQKSKLAETLDLI